MNLELRAKSNLAGSMPILDCFTNADTRSCRKVSLRSIFRIGRHKKDTDPDDQATEPVYSVESTDEVSAAIDDILSQFDMASQSSPSNLERARQLMLVADSNGFLDDPKQIERQIAVLTNLQNLAFHEPDEGGIPDIADWCLRSWLRVHAHHPTDVRVLTCTFDLDI